MSNMDMEKTESQSHIDKVLDELFKNLEEAIGVAASPATFWLLVLFGNGFDGYVNPDYGTNQSGYIQPPGPTTPAPTCPAHTVPAWNYLTQTWECVSQSQAK